MDLFAPDTSPQERAVTQALRQAVEFICEDKMDEVDRMIEAAEKFIVAPVELFTP